MAYFMAYDINGNVCQLEEYAGGTGLAFTRTAGGVQAINIGVSSTYIGVDGKVYSARQEDCKKYTTPEYIAWAKKEAARRGWLWCG